MKAEDISVDLKARTMTYELGGFPIKVFFPSGQSYSHLYINDKFRGSFDSAEKAILRSELLAENGLLKEKS